MKSVALVSLETDTGVVRRYLRVEGNKPERTGEDTISNWEKVRVSNEPEVVALIRDWRKGFVPPEDPTPRPTGPRRVEREDRAAA